MHWRGRSVRKRGRSVCKRGRGVEVFTVPHVFRPDSGGFLGIPVPVLVNYIAETQPKLAVLSPAYSGGIQKFLRTIKPGSTNCSLNRL